jgi:hypothetical protein
MTTSDNILTLHRRLKLALLHRLRSDPFQLLVYRRMNIDQRMLVLSAFIGGALWAERSPAMQFAGKVFISFASKGNDVRRDCVIRHLEDAGFPCWFSDRDIKGSEVWNDVIVQAVSACRAIVILVDSSATRSDYVRTEVQIAFERGKIIVPVIVEEGVDPRKIDARLGSRQAIRLLHDADETGFRGIINALKWRPTLPS